MIKWFIKIRAQARARRRKPMLLLCRDGRSIQRAETFKAFSVFKNYRNAEEWVVVGFEDDRSKNVLAVYRTQDEAKRALAELWSAMLLNEKTYVFKGGNYDA